MAIVDTTVPITSALSEKYLEEIVRAYPGCTLETLTETVFGRKVQALTVGEGPRKVLFTAAHHANEWITALVLLKFAEEIAAAIAAGGNIFGVEAKTIARQVSVHIVPMVNPDGVDLVVGTATEAEVKLARRLSENYPEIPFPDGWKADLLGTDLNLQYPAGWLRAREIKFLQGFTRPGPRDFVGIAPLFQREAKALAAYTEQVDPQVVLAYHTQGKEIYWQFEDIEVPGARELGEEFARLSGYELTEVAYNSSFAGYKDWFIKFFRRPGYTIEAGAGENPLPLSQFDEIYKDNLGILVTAATGLPGGA